MRYDLLAWDFNGTILDDVECDVLCANDLLRKHGLPLLKDVEAYRRVFGFPVTEYYERIGFDFSVIPFKIIADEWVAFYREHSKLCGLNREAGRVLAAAKEVGLRQCVISASEEGVLKRQLAELGVLDYFEAVVGIDNVYAESKMDVARLWREKHAGERILFVGDTTHDHEVALAIGADCVLYSGGHQCREALEATGARVIDSLSELEKIWQ